MLTKLLNCPQQFSEHFAGQLGTQPVVRKYSGIKGSTYNDDLGLDLTEGLCDGKAVQVTTEKGLFVEADGGGDRTRTCIAFRPAVFKTAALPLCDPSAMGLEYSVT
jgi:hypothetical protein